MMKTIETLRQRALIFDVITIALAVGVLAAINYLAIPEWILVIVALVALVLLVVSIRLSLAARKLEKEEALKFMEQQAEAAQALEEEEEL